MEQIVECRRFEAIEENTWTCLLKRDLLNYYKLSHFFIDEKLVDAYKTYFKYICSTLET